MNGAEDTRIRGREPDPEEEPRWLRTVRHARTAFDLIFGALVAIVALASFPIILLNPELQNPQSIGLVSGVLLTLAGVGLGTRRRK